MDVDVTNDVQAIITVNASSTKGVYEVRVLRKWRVTDSSATQTIASVDMVLIDRSVSSNSYGYVEKFSFWLNIFRLVSIAYVLL
jgi:hypothetical protein